MPEKRIGRKRKVFINITVSVASEIITMICSLILPRLILSHFGSVYNGIINSITQFISFVTLLRAGVGGVTRAALYKPLSEGDTHRISAIIKATERYMRKIAVLFLIIMTAMAGVYPLIVKDFDWFFSFSLFIVIGLSTFIQYYFGITYHMLLIADQRQYVYVGINTISIILNTVLGSALILCGVGIHAVKLASTIAFAFTPLTLNWYVRKHYSIEKNVQPDNKALSQRWDALGHQIANYILTSTDLTVLTLMADIKNVSVYSVYYLVIKAIKTAVKTFSQSVEAGFGSVIAKKETKTLQKAFSVYECFICMFCSFVFSCTILLIVPFIQVYTRSVTDFEYNRPLFAVILVLGEMMYCLRLPYMSIVEASGLYKETKVGAYFEAGINVISSVILCLFLDPLIGVAIGTLLAMTIRTIEISRFSDTVIMKRGRISFYKSLAICCGTIVMSSAVFRLIPFNEICPNYGDWLIRAIACVCIVGIVTIFVFITLYRKTTIETIKTIIGILKHRKKGK